jgi:outer membrane protein assembly factor BamB
VTVTGRLELPRARWIAVLVVLAVIAVGAIVLVVRMRQESCGAEHVDAHSPLLSPAGMTKEPDERLSTVSDAVDAMGPPFGEVRAGVGFDYGQWLHLYGVAGGLLAWTKNNAPVTLLDEHTLKARWSLRPLRKRTAWDASEDRFLLLDLASHRPTQVASYDLANGHEQWCVSLGADQAAGEPVSTTFLDGEAVLVALPGKSGLKVARLAAQDGRTVWQRELTGLDRGDFLSPLGEDLFVAGGTEEYRLAQANASTPAGPVISAYSVLDGDPQWSWSAPANTLVHVVGIASDATGDRIIAVSRSAQGTRLFALSATGAELWTTTPDAVAYESTLRGGVVLMRSRAGLDGYDAASGKLLWHRAVPADRTYFPYGFTLAQMPSLDDSHLLMPTTTALRVLDLRTGTDQAFALPVDGISTTYWPYQLAVTPGLIGVVTNIGGVVVSRANSPCPAPRFSVHFDC